MSENKIEELLSRGVANIIPSKEALSKLLLTGKKLNIYFGIDPTATKIHLGHAVTLRKLEKFADLGHNVTFLIGDFTALIGDSSDKDGERPALTPEEIEENFKTYKEQAEKVLDFSKINIRYNSEWLDKLSLREVIKLTQHFSVGDFVSRELIRKRLDSGKKVGLHEFLYPIIQGYDSLHLQTDIQLGGTDQTFNMQSGRTLIKNTLEKDSFIIATEFLMGTDGRKMSKSWGNAIWLSDSPSEIFGKIMSINDDQIIPYFILATSVAITDVKIFEEKLKSENPKIVKEELARIIVKEIYSDSDAKKAKDDFEKVFQSKELPDEIEKYKIETETPIISVLLNSNSVPSNSEAKRLIEQKAVEVDGVVVDSYALLIKQGSIIKIGKRKFLKII